ncbi:MAG: hypothetical protein AAB820_01980 [Patescibacteria group bacterium]
MKDVRAKLKNGMIVFVKNGNGRILKEIMLTDWGRKIEVYHHKNGEMRFFEISSTEIAEVF